MPRHGPAGASGRKRARVSPWGTPSAHRSSSAEPPRCPIRCPRSSSSGWACHPAPRPTTRRWPATSCESLVERGGSTRTTCSRATSPGSGRIPRTSGTSRGSCSRAPRDGATDAAREYVEQRGPEVSAGNGSVMYCAPLGVAYADRAGRAFDARAGALRHHALGRTMSDRLPRDHARGRVARARRARRPRGDRRASPRSRTARAARSSSTWWSRRGAPVRSTARTWGSRCSRPGWRCRSPPSSRGSRTGCATWSALGGDTDTNAAVAGALLGALHGRRRAPHGRGSSAWPTASALEAEAAGAGRARGAPNPVGSGRIATMSSLGRSARDPRRATRDHRGLRRSRRLDRARRTAGSRGAEGDRRRRHRAHDRRGRGVRRDDQGPRGRRRARAVRRSDRARGRPRARGARVAADRGRDRRLRARGRGAPGA